MTCRRKPFLAFSKKSWSPFQNDIALVVGVSKRGVRDSDNELEVCLPVSASARQSHVSLRFPMNQGVAFNIIIPATEVQSSVPSELYFRDRHDPSGSTGVLWLLKRGYYHTV
jgi:hypothetical protein